MIKFAWTVFNRHRVFSMNAIVNDFCTKITELSTTLTEAEISAICACMNDYLESIHTIENSLNAIINSTSKDIIQDELVNLQIELVNHIKPHITSIESPLMKLINEIE
ncbi:MAG: hypothetical protein Q8933_18265 [Bacteroidota bacterium]|nr:hypothetical protein [Bacteroidota bacterium]MDP4197133.1 hypothetical protein [Bacteroidota bacterium]